MRNGKLKQASITLPLCMALVLSAALILGLVEGARFYGFNQDAQEAANLTLESLFAGYQKTLFEESRMFFLDGSFEGDTWDISAAEDKMTRLLYENLVASENGRGISFFRMDAAEAQATGYMLATDGDGDVFFAQVAKMMKKCMGKQAVEKILQSIQSVEKKQKEAPDLKTSMQDAKSAIKEASKENTQNFGEDKGNVKDGGADDKSPQKPESKENPLATVQKLRKNGILALTLPSQMSVSEKSIPVNGTLMKRKLKKGTYQNIKNPGWQERILAQEFVKPLAGCAVSPNESGSLSYGMEYIICGNGSDEKNLKKTVNKLLLMREAFNFLYLQTDQKKQAEAMAAATAISGVIANPAIVPVVKQGILAAWAYVESICDVKAMLSGGKVSLMKDASHWKSSLEHLGEAVFSEQKGDGAGLTYENYLDVLLYAKTKKQMAYRSMDLLEWRMQKEKGYESCKMDQMIAGMKIEAVFDARTLFFGFFAQDRVGGYRFLKKAEYVYGQ